MKSINEKTMRERLLRKQQNNVSIHQPILLLKNLVSTWKSKTQSQQTLYHEAQERESKL